MATIEETIKRAAVVQKRATALGLGLGVVAAVPYFFLTLDVWRAAYLGLGTWYAAFSIAQNLMLRARGRLRPVVGSLLGFTVFTATLASIPNGVLACLPPAALAFLAVNILFDGIAHRVSRSARDDDEYVRLITSTEARKKPAQVAANLKGMQLKQFQARKEQFEGELARVEAAPESEAAGREIARLIRELNELAPLPEDLRGSFGRAHLALARHQIHRGDPQAVQTLRFAQDWPLPPGGIDFIAQQYATRMESGPDALKAYQAYLHNHPGLPSHEPVQRAARALCAAGPTDNVDRLKEVERIARGFLEADASLGWAALRLGQSLLWRKQNQAALGYLQQAAQRLPDSGEAIFHRGQAQATLGQTEPALQSFRQALALNPYDGEAAFWLAHTLVKDGRAENMTPRERENAVAQARRLLEGLLTTQPGRAEAHYAIGLVHMATGDHASARVSLSHALSLNPTDANWHYHYARALVAMQDYPAAITAAQAAIERAPGHFPALLLLGKEMRRARRWPETEQALRAAVSIDGDNPDALTGLGHALFELGRYGEVIQCLQGLESPDRDALYFSGRALARLDSQEQALTMYRDAMARFGPDAALCYALGCAHANLAQWEPALAAFEQSLALESAAAPHLQAGHVYLALGDRAAALAEYQSAARAAPDAADVHRALGAYHYAGGDVRAAKESFTQAAELNPDDALIQMGLGAVQEAQKHYAQAHSSYKAALAAGGPKGELTLRLGVIACKRKRFAEAVSLLMEAQGAIPQPKEAQARIDAHADAGPTAPAPAGVARKAVAESIGLELPDGRTECLVPDNTALPVTQPIVRVLRLGDEFPWTGANKRQFRIILCQGPHDRAAQNKRLGTLNVKLPPNLPAGTRLTLSLTLDDVGSISAIADLNDYPGWRVDTRMEPEVRQLGEVRPLREEAPVRPKPAPMRLDHCPDELLYYLGLAHAQQEQWPEAITAWSELARRCPDDAALQLDLARCQYQLGRRCFAANEFAAAASAWKQCAAVIRDDALDAALAEASFRHGTELLAPAVRGEPVPDEALTALSAAGDIEGSDSTRILTSTALLALAQGQPQLAIHQLRALCARDPHDARAAYHLGYALRQAGQDGEARQYLEEALRATAAPLPGRLHMGACLMLGEIHGAAERWDEAAQMYAAAFADATPVTEAAPAREGIA